MSVGQQPVFVSGFVSLFAAMIVAAGAQSPKPDAAVVARQSTALRSGGLHAAATITGVYVGESITEDDDPPSTMIELAAASKLIVLGRSESNTSRLVSGGRQIASWYTVQVERVLKGRESVGARILVILPGGRVSFEDGTSAQINTPGFIRPRPREESVWFLREAPAALTLGFESRIGSTGAFVPVHGPLGVLRLVGFSGNVQPSGLFRTDFARAIRDAQLTREEFIQALEAALR
jgi:hypothetical protein